MHTIIGMSIQLLLLSLERWSMCRLHVTSMLYSAQIYVRNGCVKSHWYDIHVVGTLEGEVFHEFRGSMRGHPLFLHKNLECDTITYSV